MRRAMVRACCIAPLILFQIGCGFSPSAKSSTPAHLISGRVSQTNNPQVALYTIASQGAVSIAVEFGTDINYGLTTGAKRPTHDGSPVSIYVAGMRAFTIYHMRAILQFRDGTVVTDSDHTFTTGGLPATQFPQISVSRPSSLVPQSGVELLDTITSQPQAIVTDLDGNVIW